jgi:hypothetical protein
VGGSVVGQRVGSSVVGGIVGYSVGSLVVGIVVGVGVGKNVGGSVGVAVAKAGQSLALYVGSLAAVSAFCFGCSSQKTWHPVLLTLSYWSSVSPHTIGGQCSPATVGSKVGDHVPFCIEGLPVKVCGIPQ